jgi:hypothetical protein
MKIILSVILTILSCTLFGQQLRFNNELVDTIFIQSHESSYQFDDQGATKGKADVISITFDLARNQYVIDQCYRDEYIRTTRPDTIKVDTRNYKVKIGRSINTKEIEALFTSLSTRIDQQALFEQIDTTELKKHLTEKQIRRVAKWYEVDWKFRRRYSTKEENSAFFESCKSLDTLKTYLIERFDTSGYAIISDYSSTINIRISTRQTEYRFEGKYPNPVKQPWYNHTDTYQLFGQAVLNLNINQSLRKLLPKGFLLKETISTVALVDDYIVWYLERRGMKY